MNDTLDTDKATHQATRTVGHQRLSDANTLLGKVATDTQLLQCVRRLTGHQRHIMIALTAHIESMQLTDNLIVIFIDELAKRIHADKDTTRTSIKRLQQKNLLLKSIGKRGRQGYMQVIVPPAILCACLNQFHGASDLLENELSVFRNKYRNKDALYHSSNLITTTIETQPGSTLPEAWQTIDVTPLTNIGFARAHIKQLHAVALHTPEQIQASIHHFAYGLKTNPTTKRYPEPLRVLMGVLRKGHVWVEAGYPSLASQVQQALQAQQEAEQKARQQREEAAYQKALKAWEAALLPEQYQAIAKPKRRDRWDIIPPDVRLRLYFRQKVWPTLSASVLSKTSLKKD